MGAAYTTLSLVARLEVSSGQIAGRPTVCVTGADVTPVLFMGEEVDGTEKAVCLPLADLTASGVSGATRKYVDEAGYWADLVLGTGWRHQNACSSGL